MPTMRLLLLSLLSSAFSLHLSPASFRRPLTERAPTIVALAAKKAKTVQVVLASKVSGLGKEGELVTVKAAYAQNFIIAKGLGAIATKEVLARIAADEAQRSADAAAAKQAAADAEAAMGTVFGGQGLFIKKKVGPDGALFGSVTASEIAEMIEQRAGVKVDKRHIEVPQLSHVGTAVADVQLHKEITAKLKICVVPATM
jgi:large subunit ribosomal protein L9